MSNAKKLVHDVREKHSKVDAPLDVHSTGGIQRTLAMQWDAICTLADMIDGANRSEDDKQLVESRLDERPYRAEPEPVV